MSEPGHLVFGVFEQIVKRIQNSRPVTTTGKGLTTGFVYGQLPLGMMVDPRDYAAPWSPMGGSTLQDAASRFNGSGASVSAPPMPATVPLAPGEAPTAPPAVGPDPKFRRAMQAAYNASCLVDKLILVTGDNTFLPYPTGGKISFAYETLLGAMTAGKPPELPPETKARIEEARQLLYVTGEDGTLVRSPAYLRYLKGAREHAMAKAAYAEEQSRALRDPARADAFPMLSLTLQQAVDEAYSNWRTSGADRIEAAIATIEAVGMPMQAVMISAAKKKLDAWKLGLSGVPDPVLYSRLLPSGWCDPDLDDIGWQTLTITSGEGRTSSTSAGGSGYWSQYASHASSTTGGGSVGWGFWSASAEGGSSDASGSSSAGGWSWSNGAFKNDSKDLSISLQYGVVDIDRPWFTSDLFRMKGWTILGGKAKCISDGTVEGQIKDADKMLPLVPTQLLVIRNVKITARDWGSDRQVFSNAQAQARSQSSASGSYVSGGGGFSLGFISVGGHAGHSSYDAQGSASGSSDYSTSDTYGWRFQNETLEIRGAQIIGWLSEVVPACPLEDHVADA